MSYPQQPQGWQDPNQPYSPSPGYPAYGAPPPPGPYSPGYPPGPGVGRPTNGLSIASLIVSLVGLFAIICLFPLGIIGAIGALLGHFALAQIRSRGQSGKGLAVAGIIIGWLATLIAILLLALFGTAFLWLFSQIPNIDPSLFPTPSPTE